MENDKEFFEKLSKGWLTISRINDMNYHHEPRAVVHEHSIFKLYHYHAAVKKIARTPTLIIFSTTNRPEILDLHPAYSFIKRLLNKGTNAYLLDWGNPRAKEQMLNVDHYFSFLGDAIHFIQEKNAIQKINVIAVCQGGVLALCWAALYNDIKNLVLISTPVDFHTTDHTIANFISRFNMVNFTKLDGTMPGAWLKQFFISLKPFDLLGKKYLQLIDNLNNAQFVEKFLLVEKWMHDVPDQAVDFFAEFINLLYKKNKLIKSELRLQNKKINLQHISIPILNVMAQFDDIVPISSSRPLKQYVSSQDYTERYFKSGHIGLYISEKVGSKMPLAISNWLSKRDAD